MYVVTLPHHTLKIFTEKGFEPVGYFFNPNIHPYRNFQKETARQFFKDETPLLIEENYLLEDFADGGPPGKAALRSVTVCAWGSCPSGQGKRYGVFSTTPDQPIPET